MNTQVQFKTVLSNLKKGEEACYRAIPLTAEPTSLATLETRAAARIGMDASLMQYIGELFIAQIRASLLEGRRVEIEGLLSGGIAVQGVFDAANSPWERGKHRLVPFFSAKGEMREVFAGAVGVNVTQGTRCRITSVLDSVRKEEGVLTAGENIAVYAAGATFLVDPSAAGEGVWLEDMKGKIVTLGTVTASTATTLDATFAEMPEPGQYKFVVATRGGLGKDYGVTVARRNVTVIAAS